MVFTLIRANREEAFRTKDGTLLVPCLFLSEENDSFYLNYLREKDIFIDETYVDVYKPSKGGLYRRTFKKKGV